MIRWFLFFLSGCQVFDRISSAPRLVDNSADGRLHLTPYIKDNKLDEAKKLANVTGLGWNVTSYSGLLTVDERFGSNMFIWYFPSERKPDEVPLVIWLNGFSTASSYGVFLQNGPYSLLNGYDLEPRNISWQRYYNVLYIDNPVGVGFSYTESPDGYSRDLNSLASNLHNALTQFVQLFPEFKDRELYVTGLSMGGKYVSSFAHFIHQRKSFNLKGVFLGNPVLDTAIQFNYGEYLYELGYVDRKHQKLIVDFERKYLDLLKQGDADETYQFAQKFLLDDVNVIVNMTGIDTVYDWNQPYVDTRYYEAFINGSRAKSALHVGDMPFNDGSYAMSLAAKVVIDKVTDFLEDLVRDIDLVFYAGQMDVICAYPMLVDVLNSIRWDGREQYMNADRYILRTADGNHSWGYRRTYQRLTDVMVRKSSHTAVTNQPEHIFELLLNLTDYNRFN